MRYEVPQWRTVDIIITTNKVYESPFEDVDVFGHFHGPNGEDMRLLAFWNGNQTWVLRFSPTTVGCWKYDIESTDSTGDFCGHGEVICVPYTGNLAIYRHGFLKVSDDKDYLTYADGTPFFWLGDTHWTFATEERFDESNYPKYKSQFKVCVDKRVQQKFTVYQCNFRDGDGASQFGKSLNLMIKTEKGFVPNLALFNENVDKKMKYLADVGLVIAVGYAWCNMIDQGIERYKKLAKYTAARYGAYPVVWTLAGELPGYIGDTEKTLTFWNEVAKECEKWSVYQNLQSAHLACSRPFPKIYENESWFDFAMSQAGHGDWSMDQEMYAQFKEMYKGHPVLESEATYEGVWSGEYVPRIIPAAMVRRLAYLIIQSGGCGYTYGCNGVWELQWEAGVGGIGWGDMAWWDGLNLPGADQLTILKDFYETVQWQRLKPLSEKNAMTKEFTFLADNRNQIFFTGDKEMKMIVGYMMATSMRSFELYGLTAKAYRIWWMDTETGERKYKEELIYPENGVLVYRERMSNQRKDGVIVIEAVEDVV